MRHQTSKRSKRSKGSALLETALIFMVFAGMLIGIFDFGQFLFVHQALVERARSAARWGAIHEPTNPTAIQNMVLYNQPTSNASPTYFSLTPDMVQVSSPGSGTDNYRVVVLITNYPYAVLSPYISGTYYGPNITVSVPLGLN
ncbi:MAG TPA: TadE/TadG family type IV pilus assembly protein [Bryobacteraceae bacterium]|nr:TadE/TadG family type IV pilus assembly protein [Bryobacteraceae bacterium]